MKRIIAIFASLALTAFAALSLAGPANAANETAASSLKMDPISGTLYKESFRPVNWQVETKINVPPGQTTIEPMKVADLGMPAGQLTFNPDPKMPVCGDDKIGPGLVSITVPKAIEQCPNSIIGNGLAKFALSQQTALARDGVEIVFNGGLVASGVNAGLPRIKIYAYSYDTNVGLYTEAVLKKDGKLYFDIPPLTADSSVTSLNLNIPGKVESLFVASKNLTVELPKGQDSNFAQAICKTGSWPYTATFTLGDRDTQGNPIPNTPIVTLPVSSTTPCVGAAGAAKFTALKLKGPASVKKGKKGVYKVTVKNVGTATAKGVKVKASGKGVSGVGNGGNIAPGKSKVVTVKAKFAKTGRISATFKASAGKVSKSIKKVVRVK